MTYDAIPQLGVPVHHRDLEGALDAIETFVEAGRTTGRSHQVVTVNTDFLVQGRRYADVHAILRTADLAIADGMPLVWASGALGQRLPARGPAGSDLVPALGERAAQRGFRLLFFGGTDDVAFRAADVLRLAHPGLVVCAVNSMVDDDGTTDPDVLDEIRSFRADIICVALGHPKQERWIRRHVGALGIPVGIGVGGTFDFIVGRRKRAAPWIQRSGFEWLHRLSQEPHRLTRRYLNDIAVFLPAITMQILRTRLLHRGRRARDEGRRRHPSSSVEGIEWLHSDDCGVVVSLARPGPIDHRTAAALTSLATRARRDGRVVRLLVPDAEALRSLERLRLDRLIPMIPSPPPKPGAETATS